MMIIINIWMDIKSTSNSRLKWNTVNNLFQTHNSPVHSPCQVSLQLRCDIIIIITYIRKTSHRTQLTHVISCLRRQKPSFPKWTTWKRALCTRAANFRKQKFLMRGFEGQSLPEADEC